MSDTIKRFKRNRKYRNTVDTKESSNWPANMLPADTTYIGGLGTPSVVKSRSISNINGDIETSKTVSELLYDNGRKGYRVIDNDSEYHYFPTTDPNRYYKTGYGANGVVEDYDTIPEDISVFLANPQKKFKGGSLYSKWK